jgi:hypothetical protein
MEIHKEILELREAYEKATQPPKKPRATTGRKAQGNKNTNKSTADKKTAAKKTTDESTKE